MTKSLSSSPKRSRAPDPIMTSTSSLSKSSLASSAASLSPSASILLSAAANRTSMPTGSRSSSSSSSGYRKGQPPIAPLSSSSLISTSSSSSSNRNAKLESIIQNFYTKTAQIIIHSRIPHMKNTPGKKKLNKWFNITTNDNDKLKEELKFWKALVKYRQEEEEEEEEPPPLVIDIYLETTEPDLLQEGDDVHGWRKLDMGLEQNDVQRILIESWTLSLSHPLPDYPVDLPNLYKRSIVFFRSLHSLVRVLPSYSLYQRLKLQNGEISLGYRLSTHHTNRKDEISLDHALTSVDTIQLYEFNDISTPLGTFKLKLLFREHCKFDTKEDSPLHGIDVEENFFTPTMTKYRMESKTRERTVPSPPPPPVPVFPTASSMTSAKSRLQSQRGTSAAAAAATSRSNHHYPMTSISSTTASSSNTNTSQLERRISAPLVSPFKSPSLSSSPQTELMFVSHHSRSNTPERSARPESGSFGRKPEFSSSFEKFFSKGNTHSGSSNTSASSSIHHHMHRVGSSNSVAAAGDTMTGISMTRRWSRTSDHSTVNLESEEDEEDLEEFMRFIAAKQDLKLFQQQTTQPSFAAAAATAANETSAAAQKQAEKEEGMKPLSHFRNIQETHAILSDSMILSQPQLKQQQTTQQQQQADYSYESSSSSSLTKGLNLPAIPSPLHTTESAIHPTAATHTRAAVHQNDSTFFSRHSAAAEQVVTFSPLKNRQAPPPPPPPKMPVRQHRISSSGGSGGALDDDDSLVFKMSELSGYDENAPSSGHNSSFYYGSNRDEYLQRLKMATALNDDDTATCANNRMRRAVSTGCTPNSSSMMNTAAATTAAAAVRLDSSESSCKSDPAGSMSNKFKTIQQDQGAKTTRRFFYDDES